MFVRVILPLLLIGLLVYALVDVASAEEDELGGLPKWLWVILIIFLPLAGSVAWILVRTSSRRRYAGGRATGHRPAGPAAPSAPRPSRPAEGPVAPDDDPEFLWLLEQARRKREREAKQRGGTQDDLSDDVSDRPDDATPPDDGTTTR